MWFFQKINTFIWKIKTIFEILFTFEKDLRSLFICEFILINSIHFSYFFKEIIECVINDLALIKY